MDDAFASRTNIEENGSAGGPRGVTRRLASRAANAATHGLTATKLLPEILGPELLQSHRQKFQSEWQPCTPTQAYLVEELARHAAALERATPIEEAVLRTSARGLSGISDPGDEGTERDHVLAAACGTETVDRVTRYRRASNTSPWGDRDPVGLLNARAHPRAGSCPTNRFADARQWAQSVPIRALMPRCICTSATFSASGRNAESAKYGPVR